LENLSVTQRLIPNVRSRWRSSSSVGRKCQSSVQRLLEILDTAIMVLELDVVDGIFLMDHSSDAYATADTDS